MKRAATIVRVGIVLMLVLQTGWLYAANTWYVTPDGADGNPGNDWGEANAFATIAKAVDVAIADDLILVSNGVYTVMAQTVIDKGVTVRGLDRDETVIQRSVTGATTLPTHRIFHVNHADAVLETLTVRYGTTSNTDGNLGGGIRLDAGRVNDCMVTSCYSKGNNNDWGVGMYVAGGVASNCWIVGNLGHIYASGGGGAYVGAGGLLTDSVVEGNQGANGAGVYADGGTVRRCAIFDNTAPQKFGGGAYIRNAGLVEFCVITNNTVTLNSDKVGGGVYMSGSGTLRNCLVAHNVAKGPGGGVYMTGTGGLVESCTVADNFSYVDGGGIWASGGAILNTISYFNSVEGSGANHQLSGSAAMTWSCTTPAVAGDGNASRDPDFINRAAHDYTLQLSSPAVDGGSNQSWMTGALDLAGNSRLLGDTVDMGAYEGPDTDVYGCAFSADPPLGVAPLDVRFTARVSGLVDTNTLHYFWDIDNDGSWNYQGVGLSVVDHTFAAGVYDVRLVVSNAVDSSTAQQLRVGYIRVAPATMYVSPDGDGAVPYASWQAAATTLGDALSLAADGTTILVSNGVYTVMAQTVVDKGVTIRGLDRDETVFQRSVTGDTLPRHRIFRVNHADAVLETLTVRYGHTENADTGDAHVGGGIRLDAGLVNDCRVTACYSTRDRWGVGMYIAGGVASNSWIVGNLVRVSVYGGGGAYVGAGGLLTHSVVEGNRGADGGGVYVDGGTVRRSSIFNNTADNARHGAGAFIRNGGLIEFCTITNNTQGTSSRQGGGVHLSGSGTLRNCLVAHNVAQGPGGGVYMTGGLVESCTVADNFSYADGGGIWASGGAILNTINYFNTADGAGGNHLLSGSAAMTWSCTTPAVTGEENKSGDPEFVNRAARDYTLQIGSPAINEGSTQAWMTAAADLAGNDRVQGTTVDMGAYESGDFFACGFVADPTQGIEPLQVRFSSTVLGGADTNSLHYFWDTDNDGSWNHQGVGLSVVDHTYVGGVYDVRLVVSNAVESTTAQEVRVGYIRVAPPTMYVSLDGDGQVPYASWQAAATNLNDALALAADGTTILVSNGVYTVMAQTVIDKGVTIRGLDRDETVIQRSVTGDAEPRHRIFRVNHADAVLASLTVRYGHTENADTGDAHVGGGIRLDAGRVNDCKVTTCYSTRDRWGVGMYIAGGVASNCWIVGNLGHLYVSGGGGAYVGAGGLLTHSVVEDNSGANGAGVYVDGGTVRRSAIFNNTTQQGHGGGAYILNGGLIEFGVITNNTVDFSIYNGGGVHVAGSGTLRNCLVAHNTVGGNGGGVYMTGGLVESCTVADNTSALDGGGIWASGGSILNTISYFNAADGSGVNHLLSGGAAMTWSCTTPAVADDGNKSGDPEFTDRLARDYTLQIGSPVIDGGNNQPWMEDALDLDGLGRIFRSRVDLGAYENQARRGTLFFLR